jgi:ADP-ribose pyrophosphatase
MKVSEDKKHWKYLSSEVILDKRMHVVEDQIILPSGEKSSYVYEKGIGAVAVLIATKDGIILTYQYRYPLKAWIYDLPGGGMANGETPEEAAIRECQEEVGLQPKKLTKLSTFYPNPSRTAWPAHLFFCDATTNTSHLLITNDPSEQIQKRLVTPRGLAKLVDSGKIVDPSLLIAWHISLYRGLVRLNG